MQNLFSLAQKTFLVTGASSGIGYETCKIIASMGGTVMATARSEEKLKALIAELGEGNHSYIKADVCLDQDLDTIVSSITGLDGLVHAAGIVKFAPLKFITRELMDEIRSTNYDSIVMLMQKLTKQKKINKGASIVFVSSIAGIFAMRANGVYAGTKGAMIAMSRVMANELAPQKIRVNCVAPGMVKTAITMEAINVLSAETVTADEARYPLGYGDPEDVGHPIAFLLSPASKWITGQTLILDGGRTCTT